LRGGVKCERKIILSLSLCDLADPIEMRRMPPILA
jgi:hypothetical protein